MDEENSRQRFVELLGVQERGGGDGGGGPAYGALSRSGQILTYLVPTKYLLV